MPFLLTLNPSQEQQARQYFSPATQPATPLAPQPAPVAPAPAQCGTEAQYNAAKTQGTQVGVMMSMTQRDGFNRPRFDLAAGTQNINQMIDGLIRANPSWAPCKGNLVAVATQAAATAFADATKNWQPMMYGSVRG